MSDQLRQAAQAVVDRWDSPNWGGSAENLKHTGEYIAALRAALAQQPEVRQWTGLTDIGVYFAITAAGKPPNPMSEEFFAWCEKFADAIEANLKERNA